MNQLLLSIVVIGRNEGPRLESCLSSIKSVPFGSGTPEIVYVDSASVDRSVEAARSYGADVVILDATRTTAARARNAGAAKCSGEFVLFLDGDTVLDSGFIAIALAAFRDSSIAVVWGQRREMHPRASIYNTVVDLDWIQAEGATEFCGGDAMMRRTAFDEAGGFDITLIAGEEPDLCCRLRHLGWKLAYLNRPMTRHDIAMHTVSQYWRRAVRTGYAYAQVSNRFENSPIPLWKEEAERNQTRALFLAGGLLSALAIACALRTIVPAAVACLCFFVLTLRTAVKNRSKSQDPRSLILYGLHSHLQQIPIFLGQLTYRLDVRRSLTRSLIEYKAAV